MDTMKIVLIIAAVFFALLNIVSFILGITYRKKTAEKEFGSAEAKAKAIVDDATKEAKAKQREILLEGKEQSQKLRTEAENEIKERRKELNNQERRLNQKEENLDRKTDSLEKKDQVLNQKIKEFEKKEEEIKAIKQQQLENLEKISGMTREEAKEAIIADIESQTRHEAAIMVKEIEQQAKENADKNARNIIASSIQKVAADHVAETTVSVVELPSDEMKGRIIGREGRNIRTLETATGVDLIIDDTPEAVILSSFDPIRREVARVALEKLIVDGRIHPARIEETVAKAQKEVDAAIKQAGEEATFETGVHGLHPDLIKLLGKLKYRTSYGQNVLKHSIEVSHLAGVMAGELGVDIATAKRAGLLHDIGKAVDREIEGSHVTIGADIAKKYKENKDIIHAIMAHHGDVDTETIIAQLVQAADAISAARPGARRENLETYIKRLEKLEEIADSFEGVEKSFAIQAGREIRIMVKPEVVNDQGMIIIAKDIVKKIEAELEYPGQIKISLIRETRAVDFAK
ncbi:ribonuclease Y [bacterium]|nr:ribonuclease Y [bacterium]